MFDLVKTGNAYRHLDTGDQLEGRAFRKLVGVPEGQRPTDAQFVQLLMLSLLGMAWFNSERMLEWAAEARGAGWAAGWDAAEAEAAALPCSKKEGLAFARWLVKNGPGFKKPSMFTGCGNRAQGSGPWSDALHAWLTPADAEAGPASLLEAVARKVRAARTWEEANLAVQARHGGLPLMGPYNAAQGLLTLLHGVCGGDCTHCFDASFDVASMRVWCGFGPGPITSIQEIFGGGGSDKETLSGIRRLQRMADDKFDELGLAFPYLLEEDGKTPRPLSCVDLEHSLCYFSRLLSILYPKKGKGMAPTLREQEALHKLLAKPMRDRRIPRWTIKELAMLGVSGATKRGHEMLAAA